MTITAIRYREILHGGEEPTAEELPYLFFRAREENVHLRSENMILRKVIFGEDPAGEKRGPGLMDAIKLDNGK